MPLSSALPDTGGSTRGPVRSPPARSLVEALELAGRERQREEQELDLAMSEVAREDVQNRRSIDEAYRRIAALKLLRQELEERRAAMASAASRHEWQAVRTGLQADSARFAGRAEEARTAMKARDERIAAEMASPELVAALTEFERYHAEVEPSLASMPAAYRLAISETHERNARRLAPYAAELNSLALRLDAAVEPIGVVACASPADGRPEALVLVLPLPFAVYREWATREEDLGTVFAYRIVAAVCRLLQGIGAADAPIEYFEVHGCLALQVWLGDHVVVGDLREQTLEHIARAYEEGAELRAAGVEVYGVWLRPELLTEDGA